MKNKLALTATAVTLSLGLLTGCGSATNDLNDDTNFDTNPVRYNPFGEGNNINMDNNHRINNFDPVRNDGRGTNGTPYIDTDSNYPLLNNNLNDNRNRNNYNERIYNKDNNVNTRGTLNNGTFR